MNRYEVIFKNGTVVNHDGMAQTDVGVVDGAVVVGV